MGGTSNGRRRAGKAQGGQRVPDAPVVDDRLRALCEPVGVDPTTVDDPILAALAAPGLAALVAHDAAAKQLIPAVLDELRRHQDALRALAEAPRQRDPQRTYAEIRADAERLPPSPTAHRAWTTGTLLDALLRQHGANLDLLIDCLEQQQARPGPKSGQVANEALDRGATEVHALLVARGHPSAWEGTVDTLETRGWDLGPGTRIAKANRLKTRCSRSKQT